MTSMVVELLASRPSIKRETPAYEFLHDSAGPTSLYVAIATARVTDGVTVVATNSGGLHGCAVRNGKACKATNVSVSLRRSKKIVSRGARGCLVLRHLALAAMRAVQKGIGKAKSAPAKRISRGAFRWLFPIVGELQGQSVLAAPLTDALRNLPLRSRPDKLQSGEPPQATGALGGIKIKDRAGRQGFPQ
jgi:hypothetical protein